MADKITKFEDYKKRDNSQDTDFDIQIEDPYDFLNGQEREEYYKERQKEAAKRVHEEKELPIEDEIAEEEVYEPDIEDEDGDNDDNENDAFPIDLFVRISSIITGIIILAVVVMLLKAKVLDKYFFKDPDEAQIVEVAIPSGYIEKNDTVVVTAKQLNLRSVDNSDSKSTVVTSVAEGTSLKRVAVNNEGTWALVEYNGQQVYASMKYLKESPQ